MALVYIASVVVHPREAAADLAAPDIDAGERVPIALMIIATAKGIASSSRSEINRIAAEVLKEKTNLKPDLVEQASMQECEGKLACFVERVRSDYRKADQALEDDPRRLKRFSEVRRRLREARPPPPRFLVILSVVSQAASSDRLIANLLDTDDALGYIHEFNERAISAPQDKEQLETKIAEFSVRAAPPPVTVAQGQIEPFLRKLLLEEFRAELETSGNWEPYGQAVLEVAEPGLELELDGRRIGTTKPGRTVIRTLAGEHSIRLVHPGLVPIERRASVERGKSTSVAITVERPKNEVARGLRRGAFWGGLVLAAAGAALTVLAAHQAGSAGRQPVCIHLDPSRRCGGVEFVRSGGGDSAQSIRSDPNGTGVPLAPLGYSLAGMGGAWAIGSAVGDSDSYPVLEIGIGVAVFVASLVLSAKLDGHTACKMGEGCGR